MNNEKLLSIIVPVYNVEPFLEDCIRSIERIKTAKEVICINDGSTDNSLLVLKELAHEFDDITIVEQENAGVSAARNRGIGIAKGKYICFFDSDDMVLSEIIDKAVSLLEKEQADCISYGNRVIQEKYSFYDLISSNETVQDLTVSYDLSKLYVKSCLWHSIMRKEIIDTNSILFGNMHYFEDKCFLMDFCLHCKKPLIIKEPGYLYRQRGSSVMHSKSKYKPWTADAIQAANHMEFLKDKSSDEDYQRYCQKAKQLFVLHAMTMGAMVPEYRAKYIIQELRNNGLYPFPPMWRLLVPNGKSTAVNYMRFGFFSKIYYALFFKAIRIVKKVK